MSAELRKKVRTLMVANQLNEYTALRYAERLEGTREADAAGKVVVRDELGRELARVIVPPVGAETPEASPLSRRNPGDAKIVTRDGRLMPVMTHGPRWYEIETKPSLLDIGIAGMQPLKADFTEDFDAPAEFRAFLPADPEDGRMWHCNLNHFTTHPIVVALARRYYVLAVLGEAEEGPLTITTADIGS